jgi:uncharacterized membrane protein YjfL (UPF0719 family)
MVWDTLLTAAVLIVGFFVVFFIGKLVNDLLHREYKLDEELVEKDNAALALAVAGYYFGLVLAVGGALAGPSHGIVEDLIDLAVYGALAIVLLNVSWFLCDRLILYKFKIGEELVRDQNLGTGAVSAAVSVASGFILYGSIHGEGGTIWTVLVFWAIGQAILVLAGLVYARITSYDIHAEIEKDNVAAGVGFAGALVGVGVVIGLAGEGDFTSYSHDLPRYLGYAALGLALLPIIRFLTDLILLPGVKLSDEIARQEKPNLGAAYLEAFSYLAAAFIIYWCV